MRRFLLVLGISLAVFSTTPQVMAQLRLRGATIDSGVTPTEIAKLGSWNANFAYYFLTGNGAPQLTDRASYLSWLEATLSILDTQLPLFAQQGIKVTVNMYNPPGGFSSRTTPALQAVFAEKWAQDTLIEAWQIIAARYKNNTTIAGYNLLNEPAQRSPVPQGILDWNHLSQVLADTVRAEDKTKEVVVQSLYGDPNRVSKLKPLKNVAPISYGFNMYYPYAFTHQGLYGQKLGKKYPTKSLNKRDLAAIMERPANFAKKNKAKITVAEFTAVRWAADGSAVNYLRDVISILEQKKWNWAYHSVGGTDPSTSFAYPWSLEHGSDPYDNSISTTDTPRLKLLKKAWSKNKRG